MKNFTVKLLCFFAFFALNQAVSAQDIHFSQFYNSPANLNPALVGIFKGDIRFGANYRSQWQSVPVPYLTFSGAYEQKINQNFIGNGFISGGLLFNFDKGGNGDYRISQLGLSASYTQMISDEFFIGVGAQFSIGQRALSPNQLTYGEQWNGDVYDPNIQHTEVFDRENMNMASISAGFNGHYQVDGKRTKFDFGMGLYHLNEPGETFFNNPDVVLPMKGNNYGLATVQISEKNDLRFHIIHTYMGLEFLKTEFNEIVGGVAFRHFLNLEKGREISVQPGVSFRLGDAIIPTFEIQYQNWRVGLSYDVNTSAFEVATNGKGGPEISVEYIISKVKPPKIFKVCPIF